MTALAVAAPLAIQAVRADQSAFVAGDPLSGQSTDEAGDALSAPRERSIDAGSDGDLGGIGTRPPAKGQGQTSKTETDDGSAELTDGDPSSPVLTNPEPAADPEPTEPETTTTAEPTTTTTAPATTDTSDGTTTTDSTGSSSTTEVPGTATTETTTSVTSGEETTTTDPGATTSSSEPPQVP